MHLCMYLYALMYVLVKTSIMHAYMYVCTYVYGVKRCIVFSSGSFQEIENFIFWGKCVITAFCLNVL